MYGYKYFTFYINLGICFRILWQTDNNLEKIDHLLDLKEIRQTWKKLKWLKKERKQNIIYISTMTYWYKLFNRVHLTNRKVRVTYSDFTYHTYQWKKSLLTTKSAKREHKVHASLWRRFYVAFKQMGSLLLVNKANTWRKEGGQRKECVSVRRLGCRHHTPWQSIEEEDGRSARERETRREKRPCHLSLLTLHFLLYSFHSSYLRCSLLSSSLCQIIPCSEEKLWFSSNLSSWQTQTTVTTLSKVCQKACRSF